MALGTDFRKPRKADGRIEPTPPWSDLGHRLAADGDIPGTHAAAPMEGRARDLTAARVRTVGAGPWRTNREGDRALACAGAMVGRLAIRAADIAAPIGAAP